MGRARDDIGEDIRSLTYGSYLSSIGIGKNSIVLMFCAFGTDGGCHRP
jgi:hypothetical protein